jgi:membrane AbrB-like protein
MPDEEPRTRSRDASSVRDTARRLAQTPWTHTVLALVLGAVGGYVASRLRVPLAWILGPLVACAAGALLGLPLRPLPYGREVAHAFIGLLIGLRFTPPIVAATASLLPAMVLATLYVILVTTAAAFLLRPLAQMDRKSAFFATAAAGMAEMAILADKAGGDPSAVSVVHAIRVAAVVLVIPPLVFAFGTDEGIQEPAAAATGGFAVLAVLTGTALLLAFAVRRFRLPNPWFFGPLAVGVAAAAGGIVVVAPWPALVLAQLVLGISLGVRFDRTIMGRLPRVVVSALIIAALLIAASVIGAAGLAATTSLSFATSFLAIAPAGITEMVLTARIMHLDTAAVTAFHVMRIALIHGSVLLTLRLYERLSVRLEGRRNP